MPGITEVSIKIAGITFTATAAPEELDLALGSRMRLFQVNEGKTDILLNCHYSPAPVLASPKPIFASGGPWSLYRQNRQFIFHLDADPPDRVAIVNQSFNELDLYYYPVNEPPTEKVPLSAKGRVSFDPFANQIDELLLINFLAQGRGVILHACGVADQGRGLLFVGVSGAGKSTISELWKKTEVALLSDDRIIIRRIDGRWRMFGTPWHGDANIASPEDTPLERIYFIEKTSENYVKPLSPIEAASRLLVRCFPPFYDRQGMEFTVDFLSQVAEEVPCFELGFVPDDRVIDFVRGL